MQNTHKNDLILALGRQNANQFGNSTGFRFLHFPLLSPHNQRQAQGPGEMKYEVEIEKKYLDALEVVKSAHYCILESLFFSKHKFLTAKVQKNKLKLFLLYDFTRKGKNTKVFVAWLLIVCHGCGLLLCNLFTMYNYIPSPYSIQKEKMLNSLV